MGSQRMQFEEGPYSLLPLVEATDLLELQPNGRIYARDLLPTPVDEHGVPRRVELIRQVLGTVATRHIWTGDYDVHHTAWPGNAYRKVIDRNSERIGSMYRGAGSLKVWTPRQLHNYIHKITEPPTPPPLEVMRQYALEHGQVDRLYDTIKVSSYIAVPELAELPFEEQELLRKEAFDRKLDQMHDGEIGIMPDREYLAQLEIAESRNILRSIARVQGFSNASSCQKTFFAAS